MVSRLWPRQPVGWLVALMLAAGAAFLALLVLGSGLLASALAAEIGVSALAARGGPLLWLYLFNAGGGGP